ncbi:cytochrome P450 [Microbacterium sp. No. 7]|uniref:cytochrome P450 n=1 Tax=Microbacterium sp. No. 7 TaxID=1714373 RepID=UPI0006D2B38A|nr:cytochrome P450 [Microbacterium sp. No. 7]ALJ21947.1 cytochrome [Microbacterium sp. No. 7]
MSTVEINPNEVDFFTDREVAARAEPYFDHMLAHHPVFREPKYGVVIVTGYEEALQVYHQPDVYSSINRTGGPVVDLPVELVGDDISEILEQHRELFSSNDQIVTFDPPMHTDHRAILMGLITPKRLKENESFLKRTADQYLDELLPQGHCEFIWDYAKKYTILAVGDLLGVPEEDFPLLLERFASGGATPVLGNLELQVNHYNALELMYDYFVEKIEERRVAPKDDVLTGMALATFPDGSLPEPIEVARIASNLFAAGQETTVQIMGICMQRIAEDAELQQRLREDFSLIPKFIEETLRIEAPIKGSFRLTKRPTTLGGLDLPVGTVVMLLHGAAGRDPRVFEDPATFDVDRANARQHLAFGRGIHTCPGAPLARAEAVFSIERFLSRTSSITIDAAHHGPAGERSWDLIESYKFHGHTHLYLDYAQSETE